LLAFRPATLPFPYRAPALLRPIWRLPIHLQLTKALKEAGFETFDVLTFDPHCQPFLDRCRSQLNRVVYYAVDPPLGAEDIRWPERRLVRDSNSVLAVTERLAQLLRKESDRQDIQSLPHGIDYEAAADLSGDCELPK